MLERFLGSLERELWRRLRLLPLRVAGIEWHAASYLERHDAHGASSCTRGTDGARGARAAEAEDRAAGAVSRGDGPWVESLVLVLRSGRVWGEPNLPVFELEVRRAA